MSCILLPALPVITASGLLLSIQSVLVQFKVLPSDTNANIWGFLLFMFAITGLSLVGIFFCYNTVKFFGGNPLYVLLVGLILTSRLYANITPKIIPMDILKVL
ncbi:hypothetical protein [Mesoplasma melaleucae]|uniref:hypothetical protein n=1 Tax=Mesoplasma melaleucae TaxID=81459 RepID=UPI0012EB7380|nr:hypothetical protein [Mesoplasma melaleucae]